MMGGKDTQFVGSDHCHDQNGVHQQRYCSRSTQLFSPLESALGVKHCIACECLHTTCHFCFATKVYQVIPNVSQFLAS